jgi:hypothetical protein
VDGDGYLDIAVANHDSDDISVLMNHGNGSFHTAVNYGLGDRPFSVALGDIDGDGDLDLAVANFFSDNVSVLINFHNLDVEIVTGDFDGDGVVTHDDLSDYFLSAYGKKASEPGYVAEYDVNLIGLIDMLDYVAWYEFYMDANQ